MSSGFPGGLPDFFTAGRRSAVVPSLNMNSNNLNPQQQQVSFRSPPSGIQPDQIEARRRPDLIGKRSLAEFQQLQQSILQQQGLGPGVYLRNVKPRLSFQHASPISTLSSVDFPTVTTLSPEISSVSSISSMSHANYPRYGFPILPQQRPQSLIVSNTNNASASVSLPNLVSNKAIVNFSDQIQGPELFGQESEKKMLNHKLLELEKQLLGDEDEGEAISVVTSSEWSETIQNLINPTQNHVSSSPTSSSSSCSSTSASPPLPCPKQSLIDAAVAISEGKPDFAAEIFTRLQPAANAKGSSEQRLAAIMVSALKSRVVNPPPVPEIYGKEHAVATQMLYEVSPCFKLGFMAANLAILEATSDQALDKIHVVDFDIGQGGQYVHLLHALAAARKGEGKPVSMLKITALSDSSSAATSEERLKVVGEGLKALAIKLGICFTICSKSSKIADLSRENLGVLSDEALAVNFAFQLYRLPDESVTTENFRDELLRRVKGMSPTVMTVVEQEMNANTAPLTARVREVCEHYGALFDSLDATVSKENSDRVRIEDGLSQKIRNSVACEGRDRVERCEVFGKWRARVGMAGFKIRPMSQLAGESLRSKLNSGTRGNPGFTVNEQFGGICFGWMGRTLTVASAWC